MTSPDVIRTAAMEQLEAIHGPLDQYLRLHYEAMGQSQATIASLLGVNVATVNRYMREFGIPARRFGWNRSRAA